MQRPYHFNNKILILSYFIVEMVGPMQCNGPTISAFVPIYANLFVGFGTHFFHIVCLFYGIAAARL